MSVGTRIVFWSTCNASARGPLLDKVYVMLTFIPRHTGIGDRDARKHRGRGHPSSVISTVHAPCALPKPHPTRCGSTCARLALARSIIYLSTRCVCVCLPRCRSVSLVRVCLSFCCLSVLRRVPLVCAAPVGGCLYHHSPFRISVPRMRKDSELSQAHKIGVHLTERDAKVAVLGKAPLPDEMEAKT
jgi:hypothetical protein